MARKRSLREQTRKYASGKKVYRHGSTAPTRGTVKPGGYIKREMKKRGTMQSQTRSGLAAQALRKTLRRDISRNRFGTNAPNTLNAQQKKTLQTLLTKRWNKVGGSGANLKSPRLRQTYQSILGNSTGAKPAPAKPKPAPAPAKPAPAKPATPATPATPAYTPPDYVKINTNGQLDLPYDESFSWDMLGKKQEMNNQLLELQQAAQDQSLEYEQIKRGAGQEYEDLNRDTLNDHAARGMAFSSGYGYSVGENANQYNQFVGDLEKNNSLFQSQIAQQRSGIENAFNDYLRQAALQRSLELAPDAGELGYGTTPIKPSYDKITAPTSSVGKAKAPSKKTGRTAPKTKAAKQKALTIALRREISKNLYGKAPNQLKPAQRKKVDVRVRRKSTQIAPGSTTGTLRDRYLNILNAPKKGK